MPKVLQLQLTMDKNCNVIMPLLGKEVEQVYGAFMNVVVTLFVVQMR
jgi:hypothetical protein